MEIEFSSYFIKRARRLSQEDKIVLSERVEWFRLNPGDPRLKIHPLTGKLKDLFAFSLRRRKRVKFSFLDKNNALFVDVGSHDEVY